MNVNVNWLLIVRIQMKRLPLMYAIPANTRKRLKLLIYYYMTEVQARRCLDYLDGARYVLAGNLRRVASTMYLLTPINVVVNIEDIRLPNDVEVTEFDYDMKRNR